MKNNLLGKFQCFHCKHIFKIPAHKKPSLYDDIECPNCSLVEFRQHYKCHEDYEFKHPLGWPYDDPTIDYDC